MMLRASQMPYRFAVAAGVIVSLTGMANIRVAAQALNLKPIPIKGVAEVSTNAAGTMFLVTIDNDPPDGVWDQAYLAETSQNEKPLIMKAGSSVSGEYDRDKALVLRLQDSIRIVIAKDMTSVVIGPQQKNDKVTHLSGIMRLNFEPTKMTHAELAAFVFAQWKTIPLRPKR